MTDVLTVWLNDLVAGSLERGRRGGFRFLPEADGPSISVSAPGAAPWQPARSLAWFDGLLPEGEMRARIAARFGIDSGDVFGLLGAIGWECAGAVSILPPGRSPGAGSYAALSEDEVGRRLDALPGRPYDEDQAVRASLGGVQSKLVMLERDGAWFEPLDGAPSTHILKPEPEPWPGMATAEAWSLRAASAVTSVATATVRTDVGQRPVLVVKRFDRRPGTPVRRIHQEDLCQLLGLPSSAKYAEPPPKDWKPSLLWLASLLLARATDPTAELLTLLDQVTANVALGNADAHAKNVAVLHAGDGFVTMAPMYDVVPTVAFLPRQTHAALPVGGRYRLDQIERRHVIAEARSWGVPERVARGRVRDALARLTDGLAEADRSYPGLAGHIRDVVSTRLATFSGSPED